MSTEQYILVVYFVKITMPHEALETSIIEIPCLRGDTSPESHKFSESAEYLCLMILADLKKLCIWLRILSHKSPHSQDDPDSILFAVNVSYQVRKPS